MCFQQLNFPTLARRISCWLPSLSLTLSLCLSTSLLERNRADSKQQWAGGMLLCTPHGMAACLCAACAMPGCGMPSNGEGRRRRRQGEGDGWNRQCAALPAHLTHALHLPPPPLSSPPLSNILHHNMKNTQKAAFIVVAWHFDI